ncbi:hypothetical protein D9M70_256130 [compost metagenome]
MVLNTPPRNGLTAARQLAVSFILRSLLRPGSAHRYKTRKGKHAGRLRAVFTYLAAL